MIVFVTSWSHRTFVRKAVRKRGPAEQQSAGKALHKIALQRQVGLATGLNTCLETHWLAGPSPYDHECRNRGRNEALQCLRAMSPRSSTGPGSQHPGLPCDRSPVIEALWSWRCDRGAVIWALSSESCVRGPVIEALCSRSCGLGTVIQALLGPCDRKAL